MAEFQLSPIAFGDLFTFSRSTEATYWDMYGRLRTAAIDERRIAYDPTTLRLSEVNQTSVNGWNITTLAVGQLVTITLQDSAYVYNVGWRIRVSNPTYVDSSFDPGFWGTVEESEPGLLRVRVSKIEIVPDINGGGGTIGAWNVVRAMGIQVEDTSVNYIGYSEDFSQWNNSGQYSFATTPSGSPSGGAYQTITKNNPAVLTYSVTGVNGKLTVSAFVKDWNTPGDWNFLIYNVTRTGIISQFMEMHPDGGFSTNGDTEVYKIGEWYHVISTIDTTTGVGYESGDTINFYANSGGGSEGGSCDIWGYQVEPKNGFTSYIPNNSGAAVARARDILAIDPLTSWFSQNQGTIVFTGVRSPTTEPDWAFQFNGDSSTSRIFIRDRAAPNSVQAIYDWGPAQSSVQGAKVVYGEVYKGALSFTDGTIGSFAMDGEFMGNMSIQYADELFTQLWLGMNNIANFQNSKTIEEFRFYPYAMNESQLIEVTS